MRRLHMRALPAILGLSIVAQVGGAQGSVSNQGFGYPTGQLSAAALAAGGATAESDPSSGLNPAAITQPTRFAIQLQFEPEWRRTTVGGVNDKSAVMRFPSFVATGGWRRLTGAVGVTTLLDRTWVNEYRDSLLVLGDWIPSNARLASDGAISDVRAALGYALHPRLQVGVGLHGVVGENRTEFLRSFPDTSGVGALQQYSSVAFSGRAVSFGAVATPRDGLVLAASIRSGGAFSVEENRTEVAEASVPTRYGAGVSWLVIPGAWLSGRVEQVRWSDMRDLGTANLSVFDATEFGVGLDVLGPRVAGANSVVRAGLRDRTLPFGVNGNQVSERGYSFGVGIPVARGRSQIDLAVQRAHRSVAGASERAWFASIGFGIRP